MKKTLFCLFMLLVATAGFSTTWTITNSGFEFSPDDITIQAGDSVLFELASMHNAVEVSQATWEANGNNPLEGGFSVPFGGGLVLPEKLSAGTHYYVCAPHASGGMKGIIEVQNPTGVPSNPLSAKINVYPNPTRGKFKLDIVDTQFRNDYQLSVYDLKGILIFTVSQAIQQSSLDLDLTDFPKGLYFIKLSEGDLVYHSKILVQ